MTAHLHTEHVEGCYRCELSADEARAALAEWVRAHAWAVTTEADCNGWPEDLRSVTRYALYDANEDDPPIAVFDFREDAERVAIALTEFGALFGPSPAARSGEPS